MERNWQDYVSLHQTIEGARAAFEGDCQTLLMKIHPSKNVRIARADPGDDGIDIFIGEIGVEPIHVYQCKFFLDSLGESQRGQIRESFKTALGSDKFELKEWHLWMPIRDLNVEENTWWSKWKTKQVTQSNVIIGLLNGNEIKALFKEYNLYNTVFKIEDSLAIQETNRNLKILISLHQDKSNIVPGSLNNYPIENVIGNSLFNVAFALRYKTLYENFYVNRDLDNFFNSSLSTPKNIWLYGASGIGKTIMCARNLSRSSYEFFYCYLNAGHNAQDVNDLLQLIYENIYSKYEDLLSGYRYKGDNWINKIVNLLLNSVPCENLIICIDEVPVSSDSVFKDFANSITAICTDYANNNQGQGDIKFVISTIKNPKLFYGKSEKISDFFTFIELPAWPIKDLISLYNSISNKLGLVLAPEDSKILLEQSTTPRILKTILYQYATQYTTQSFQKVLSDVLDKH